MSLFLLITFIPRIFIIFRIRSKILTRIYKVLFSLVFHLTHTSLLILLSVSQWRHAGVLAAPGTHQTCSNLTTLLLPGTHLLKLLSWFAPSLYSTIVFLYSLYLTIQFKESPSSVCYFLIPYCALFFKHISTQYMFTCLIAFILPQTI